MKINERGYWENPTSEGHGGDFGLAKALAMLLGTKNSVLDLGCGDGFYTKYLLDRGVNCVGYDGNPYTSQITNGLCQVADFTIPQRLGKFDWVICLEVGEHIPEEYESILLDNIVACRPYGVVLSWAIPGQGGDGHVNCHTNEYVTKCMEARDYIRGELTESTLRDKCAVYPIPCYWFRDTLMVFYRELL